MVLFIFSPTELADKHKESEGRTGYECDLFGLRVATLRGLEEVQLARFPRVPPEATTCRPLRGLEPRLAFQWCLSVGGGAVPCFRTQSVILGGSADRKTGQPPSLLHA